MGDISLCVTWRPPVGRLMNPGRVLKVDVGIVGVILFNGSGVGQGGSGWVGVGRGGSGWVGVGGG